MSDNPSSSSPSAPLDTEDLKELKNFFTAFDEVEFKKSHENLMGLVSHLSEELDVKNKVLEQKIQEVAILKAQSDNILESISDAVVAINTEGSILSFNRMACDLTRCTTPPKNLHEISSNMNDAFLPLFQLMQDVVEARLPSIRDQEVNVVIDQTLLTYSLSVNPVLDLQQRLTGVVASFSDRTEIYRLQNDLKRRDRLHALGEMAAGVAHEIRNPLGGIGLYADVLAKNLKENQLDDSLAQKISRAVTGLNRLVEDMLTFTRTPQLNQVRHKIKSVISPVVDIALSNAPNNNITVDYPTSDGDLCLYIDIDQIQQLLLNIIGNACQAMGQAGRLSIAWKISEKNSKMINISISDSGPGINAEDQDKIFNPFFTKGKKDGTGLGLPIAYKTAQSHGGEIFVDNDYQDGARFIIALPIHNPSPLSNPSPTSQQINNQDKA